jgi:hypothetical protein
MGLKKANEGIRCPSCSQLQPALRRATSLRQTLVGGWTCGSCGCEMDRSGRKIEPSEDPVVSDSQQLELSEEIIAPFDEQGRTPIERVFEEEE